MRIGLVTGHDFSRAELPMQNRPGFSPAEAFAFHRQRICHRNPIGRNKIDIRMGLTTEMTSGGQLPDNSYGGSA
jgi:hypothetical protein